MILCVLQGCVEWHTVPSKFQYFSLQTGTFLDIWILVPAILHPLLTQGHVVPLWKAQSFYVESKAIKGVAGVCCTYLYKVNCQKAKEEAWNSDFFPLHTSYTMKLLPSWKTTKRRTYQTLFTSLFRTSCLFHAEYNFSQNLVTTICLLFLGCTSVSADPMVYSSFLWQKSLLFVTPLSKSFCSSY